MFLVSSELNFLKCSLQATWYGISATYLLKIEDNCAYLNALVVFIWSVKINYCRNTLQCLRMETVKLEKFLVLRPQNLPPVLFTYFTAKNWSENNKLAYFAISLYKQSILNYGLYDELIVISNFHPIFVSCST